jgi:acyl-CoA dehydrogenase
VRAGLEDRAGPATRAVAPVPPFTSEHESLRREMREFVEAELRPHAGEWERERWFPNDVFGWLAARGYLGLKYSPEYGGRGDHLADAVLCEELARCGSGGLAAGIGAHTGIATPPIAAFGTEDQKRRWLVPAIRGERVAALGITEPGAGSDVAGIRTRAQRVDGGWVVNGAKTYITNGVRADYVVTAVKTAEAGGHQGLSFLVIERGSEGVAVSRKLEKLGWHASDTAELSFSDVFVPRENLLGEENRGFYLIMANFQWERLLLALGAVGSMTVILERLTGTGATADGNGRPARSSGQARRHAIARIALELEASRAITYQALRLFVTGQDAVREVTMAKLVTQRAAYDFAEAALRIRSADGDAGEDELVELDRAARDTRLGPIGGGTDEVMKEILGRQLGL